MSDKLSQTIEQFKKNPLDVLKKFTKEKQQLKQQVVEQSLLIGSFVEYIKTHYQSDIESLGWSEKIQEHIQDKIWEFSMIDDVASTIVPELADLKSTFTSIQSMLWWSEVDSIVDEYVSLRKQKPFDKKRIEEWMQLKGIKLQQAKLSPWTDTKTGISSDGTISSQITSITTVENKNNLKTDLTKVIALAKSEIGANEKDNSADKYFRELWYKYDSKKQPWCGAFVSWTLMKAGFSIPKNDLSAKAFIDESGTWHVGIKVEWKVVSWNYWNKVTFDEINRPIKWYAIPTLTWLDIHKESIKFEDIPEGAVVVFDRNKKRSQAA